MAHQVMEREIFVCPGGRTVKAWKVTQFSGCSVLSRSYGNLSALLVMAEFEFGSTWILCKILMHFLLERTSA